MKNFILNNVSLILLIFLTLGLLLPNVEHLSAQLIPAILGIVIFFACFKIDIQEIKNIQINYLLIFYFLRFILFPPILFFLMHVIFPAYAVSVFLLALLPTGTSSPAMTAVYKGNVAISFGLLLLASLLAPFAIPILIEIVMGKSVSINILSLLTTLFLSIIVPVIVFSLLRSRTKLTIWAKQNGSMYSILLIGMTLMIATAKRKEIILHSPSQLIVPVIISSIILFILYAFGWLILKRTTDHNKIAYSLSSGANNLTLGIGIALLYFPPQVCLFLIAAEIPWIFAFMPFKVWIKSRNVLQTDTV